MTVDERLDKPAAWGDDEALAALVREHYARVQRFGARACRDADAADDVVQEAFIKLASRPELLAHRGVLSWLLTSVRRACVRLLRSLQRWQTLLHAQPQLMAAAAPEDRELLEAVHEAIARIEPEYRAALVLRDLEGLSGEETASVLGVPVATMKTRLHRARRAVREEPAA